MESLTKIDPDLGFDEPMRHKPTGDAGMICKVEYDNRGWVERLCMHAANSGAERKGTVADFEEIDGQERQHFFERYPSAV